MTIIVVSGFGRCGSSLVMQMLEAGGCPVTGQWPAFEDPAASAGGPLLSGDAGAAAMFEGKAVKVLDLHRGRLPVGPEYRIIWCKRSYKEQAKSQRKFLRMVTGIQVARDHVQRLAQSLAKDTPAAMASLQATGGKMLTLNFEDVVHDPRGSAKRLAGFLGLASEAAAVMACAVRHRSPECALGMGMEMTLMEARP